MADTVSKLYAEIGFKVNQDGLKQAQKIIQDMATQMKAISDATKEAAKQYGIFSREQAKQELQDARVATEKSRKAYQDRRKEILDKRELERQERQAKKDKDREERQALKDQEQAQRKQQREAEKAAKEQQKRLKGILQGFRNFAVGLRNTFLTLAGVGAGGIAYGMKQSLDRSIPTRNFMMTTGVELADLQEVMRRMINTGSSMSQQQIMGDIQKVSQNLADIALGQGELSPYKLLSVAAQRGDVMGVIKGVEQSVKHLDNAMALNLTRRVGLSDDWLAMWRYREREGGDQRQISREQQNEIIEAEIALRQLKFAFKNLADFLTASISPSLTKMANGIRDWLQSISSWIDEHPNTIRALLEDLGELANAVKFVCDVIITAGVWLFEKISEIVKAPKALWENSSIGRYLKEHKQGGMSKMNPAFEDELLQFQKDNVKEFNNDRRLSSRNIVNATDNSVQNVTINGVAQEEIAEKAKEAVEEANKKEETIMQQKLYGAADLWVVAPTIAG